ncbi:unnamed protein product [Alternaria alternata]
MNDKSPPCSTMVEDIKKQLWHVGELCYDKENCKPSDAPVKYCLTIELYEVNGDLRVFDSNSVRLFDSQSDLKTLGYSPLAIIAVLALGGLMVISMVAFGYIPYKRGMPLAGTCSLAISAACHPTEQVEGDENIAEKMLQWGVVSIGEDEIGHCAFSADEVGAVVKGKLYGGTTA